MKFFAAGILMMCVAAAACFPKVERKPEPYEAEEFSPFLHTLRRAESIFIGSIPFSLFVSLELYDVYRYASHSFDPRYAPWPFGLSSGGEYTGQEQIGVVITSLSLSAVLAVVDMILGLMEVQEPEEPRGDVVSPSSAGPPAGSVVERISE